MTSAIRAIRAIGFSQNLDERNELSISISIGDAYINLYTHQSKCNVIHCDSRLMQMNEDDRRVRVVGERFKIFIHIRALTLWRDGI